MTTNVNNAWNFMRGKLEIVINKRASFVPWLSNVTRLISKRDQFLRKARKHNCKKRLVNLQEISKQL